MTHGNHSHDAHLAVRVVFQQVVIYLCGTSSDARGLPWSTYLPSDKLFGATKTGRKAFVVRQIVHHRENGMLTINVELRHQPLATTYQNMYTSTVSPLLPVLEVRFYATDLGREPVRDWLKSLPPDARKSIGEDLKTVQFGWPLGMPLVRKMEPGLWEVHSTIEAGIARVLFTTVGAVMVLLHGFVKKTAKTPMGDLKLALRRMKDVHHG